MFTIILTAQDLRTEAEQGSNPEAYEQAAAEYEAVNMQAAAQRCRERAKHYREVMEHADPELHD